MGSWSRRQGGGLGFEMLYGRRRDIHFFMSDHLLSEPLGGLRECSERPQAPGVLERRGEKPRVRWHDAGIQERGTGGESDMYCRSKRS